jgi:hypothetical protein
VNIQTGFLLRKYWGVSYRAEKREPRAKFKGMYEDDSVAAAFNEALAEAPEYVMNDMKSPAERITKAFYMASIRVQDKRRYLGKTVLSQKAARLYDAALFYLWGFLRNPQVTHFNFYKPGIDPDPVMDEQLREVKHKICWELREKQIDPTELDCTFVNREKL